MGIESVWMWHLRIGWMNFLKWLKAWSNCQLLFFVSFWNSLFCDYDRWKCTKIHSNRWNERALGMSIPTLTIPKFQTGALWEITYLNCSEWLWWHTEKSHKILMLIIVMCIFCDGAFKRERESTNASAAACLKSINHRAIVKSRLRTTFSQKFILVAFEIVKGLKFSQTLAK